MIIRQFFLPMELGSKTYQSGKRVRCVSGKPVFYEDDELKDLRGKFEGHLYKHCPSEPIKGPVQLMVKWCYPNEGRRRSGEYKATRPDVDNLQKLLMDCMSDVGFWEDDAQVASMIVEKFWADQPGVAIGLRRLGG